jgi:hypothetical protein
VVSILDVPENYDGGAIGNREPWKVIEAAVCGCSEADSKIAGYCDPESLVQAADAFVYVQDVFTFCHAVFDKCAKSIAGPGKAWQGAAADAFLERMQAHAKVMESHVQTITGWAGKWGSADLTGGKDSIVTGLVNAANTLATAQGKIEAIDSFYAAAAARSGAGDNADGTVTVSSRPDIVTLMNQDMGKVFADLQQDYSDNTNRYYRPAIAGTITKTQNDKPDDTTFHHDDWKPPPTTDLGDSGGLNLNGPGGGNLSGPTPWDGDGGAPGSYTASGSGTGGDWKSSTTPWDSGSPNSAWDPSTVSTGVGSYDPYASSGLTAGTGGGYGAGSGTGGAYGNGAGGTGTGGTDGAYGAGGARGLGGAGLGPAGLGPGMGGAGHGNGEQERERSTWLVEDRDVWGADPALPPDVLGRH